MPDLATMANNAQLVFGKDRVSTVAILSNIYSIVMQKPGELNLCTYYPALGKAFAMMIMEPMFPYYNLQQQISSISYILLSISLKQDGMLPYKRVDVLKDRLILVESGQDSLSYSHAEAESGGYVMSDIYQRKAGRPMSYMLFADLYEINKLGAIEWFDFAPKMYSDLKEYLTSSSVISYSEEQVAEIGRNQHDTLIEYLDERIMNKHDLNF